MLAFDEPLRPFSSITGAASLDWRSRPGNYGDAQAAVEGVLRLAAAPAAAVAAGAQAAVAAAACVMAVGPPAARLSAAPAAAPPVPDAAAAAGTEHAASPPPPPVQRAVFVFDWRDSVLFHALEDTMRHHNARALGLAAAAAPATGAEAAAEAAGAEGGAEASLASQPSVRAAAEAGHKAAAGRRGQQRLAAALAAYEGIALDGRLLQVRQHGGACSWWPGQSTQSHCVWNVLAELLPC